LQVTPFSLNVAGTVLDPFDVALKPNEVDAPVASEPL
jgi:hypothetical protein